MKKILLIGISLLGVMGAFAQVYPDNTQNAQNSRELSPQVARTAYLTNLNGKLMQAYPNPARDEVVIQHVASADRAVLSLIGLDGKIVQQQTVMPNTLQTNLRIGSLPRGLYVVRFDNSRGDVRTLRLVKD